MFIEYDEDLFDGFYPANLASTRKQLHSYPLMDLVANSPLLKAFLAGSCSGTCSTVMFQPLDLVKTRLQNSTTRSLPSSITPSNGMVNIMTHIFRQENIFGLWKGMAPSMTRCVPGVGLYFASLHALQNSLCGSDRPPGPLEAVGLGVVARSFSGSVLIPFTVIKTRYESGLYQYGSVLDALKVIYRVEGVRGLTSGLAATLFRDAPYSGLYLMLYTQSRQRIPSEIKHSQFSTVATFTCAVFSGLLASTITQPADVVKTKIQLFPNKFESVFRVMLYIQEKYGYQGFFKGLVPRMLRRTMMTAMAWTIYEQVTRSLGLH